MSFSITEKIETTLIQRHESRMSRVISQLIETQNPPPLKKRKGKESAISKAAPDAGAWLI